MGVSKMLRLCACIVLDIAIILGATQFLLLFPELSNASSFVFYCIVITGLLIWNLILIAPRAILQLFGVAYATFILAVLAIYPFISIIVSLLMIEVSLLWLVCTQLVILFFVIIVIAVVVPFGKANEQENDQKLQVQAASEQLNLLLLQIENVIEDQKSTEHYNALRDNYQLMKERIHASSPFSKFNGRVAVNEMENSIIEQLHILYQRIKPDQPLDNTVVQAKIQQIIQLIKHREQLLIK